MQIFKGILKATSKWLVLVFILWKIQQIFPGLFTTYWYK